MKRLLVPFTTLPGRNANIQDVSNLLDRLEKNAIDIVSWKTYGYKPKVTFSMAHSNDCLFIKFNVSEKAVRAKYRNINDPVHKDSCVEFFIVFNDHEGYYNFEFNCLGTSKVGFGPERKNREKLPPAKLSQIKSMSVIRPFSDLRQDINWELTLMIPRESFCKHAFAKLSGVKSRANFFKCGDELPMPHFLSWTKITAEEPNFHLPEFFGEVQFE